MKLIKIQLPILSYTHVFKSSDGTLFEIDTTEADYKQLGTSNPVNPTSPDGEWVFSHSHYRIPQGCYAEEVNDTVIVGVDGYNFCVKKNDIESDELKQSGIDKINKIKANANSI